MCQCHSLRAQSVCWSCCIQYQYRGVNSQICCHSVSVSGQALRACDLASCSRYTAFAYRMSCWHTTRDLPSAGAASHQVVYHTWERLVALCAYLEVCNRKCAQAQNTTHVILRSGIYPGLGIGILFVLVGVLWRHGHEKGWRIETHGVGWCWLEASNAFIPNTTLSTTAPGVVDIFGDEYAALDWAFSVIGQKTLRLPLLTGFVVTAADQEQRVCPLANTLGVMTGGMEAQETFESESFLFSRIWLTLAIFPLTSAPIVLTRWFEKGASCDSATLSLDKNLGALLELTKRRRNTKPNLETDFRNVLVWLGKKPQANCLDRQDLQ